MSNILEDIERIRRIRRQAKHIDTNFANKKLNDAKEKHLNWVKKGDNK